MAVDGRNLKHGPFPHKTVSRSLWASCERLTASRRSVANPICGGSRGAGHRKAAEHQCRPPRERPTRHPNQNRSARKLGGPGSQQPP